MTRDDIIRMAREAGFKVGISVMDGRPFIDDSSPVQGQNAAASGVCKPRVVQACLERFAALVAAAEREECAKVADKLNTFGVPPDIAAAIRARGQA